MNAKQFSKLAAERTTDKKRIIDLEVELKAALASRDAYVRQALDAQKAHHDEDWRHAEEHHDVVKATLEQALAKVSDLECELVKTKGELERSQMLNGHANQLLEIARGQLAEIQPQLDLIAQQRADLEHILDGVRERMKRKEQENERAILNRKALASARPDFNRR